MSTIIVSHNPNRRPHPTMIEITEDSIIDTIDALEELGFVRWNGWNYPHLLTGNLITIKLYDSKRVE